MSKLLSNIPIMQPLLEGLPILLLSLAAGCHPEPAAADPLASPPVAGYAGDAGPYGQTGLASGYHRRTTAQAVFLCVSCSAARVMAGCMGHPSGWPVPMTGRPTLYSPPPHRLASVGGGESPIIGVTTMANHATRPSATRHRSVRLTAIILLSLKPGVRTGTAEIHQRLTEAGIPVSLRAVQRYLNTLAETLPIEGDGQSPQGWRWIKAPDVVSLVERAGGAA